MTHTSACNTAWLDNVQFDSNGLIPAIAQETVTHEILMVAWMNREALSLSVSEGYAVYWSRSRKRLWRKGEESGHRQRILSIRMDCDSDVILLEVEQAGGIACHTGRHHCFFRQLLPLSEATGNTMHWQIVEPVLKQPETIYQAK